MPLTYPISQHNINNPNSTYNIDCKDFETDNEVKGAFFQTIALYGIDGNMVWCKRFNSSEFHHVIQDSDGNIVAIGQTKSPKYYDRSAQIWKDASYNPTSTNTSGTIASCSNPGDYAGKLSVTKVDLLGNEIWSHTYGMKDGSDPTWQSETTQGWGIAEFQNGYRIVGRNSGKGFMAQLNKSGHLLQKQTYSYSAGKNLIFFDVEVGNGNLAVAGREETTAVPYDSKGIVHYFPSTNSFQTNSTNFKVLIGSVLGNGLTKAAFVTFLPSISAFAVPVFYNGDFAAGGWSGYGDCELQFFADDFSPLASLPNTQYLGNYRAFDLKLDVVPTSNGFATVSSKRALIPGYTPTVRNLLNAIVLGCYSFNNSAEIQYWDTDASVAKYSLDPSTLAITKLWETTFDADGKAREPFPGDIKRQECLYTITEDDADGSLVIAGNTSNNFDDSYLVKLQPDCIQDFYDIQDLTDYVYDISANTTWNSSKTVLGEVRVKTGATLTISGTNTVISMSDAKLTGSPSFLTVEKGAKLIIDGATITSDNRCSNLNPKWDGIRILGDNNLDQNRLSNQGYVEIQNNAVIENVMYAIMFGEPGNWNDFGGRIEATDATFRVVRRAAEFMRYPHHNYSFFERCTFEYELSINEEPLPLVTLWDNHGVEFRGCTFRDQSQFSNSYYSEYGGNGIFSIDATYTVKASNHGGNTIRSSFEHLNQGVYALGAATGNITTSIEKTDFTENGIGFRVNTLDNVRFVQNEVLLGTPDKQGVRNSLGLSGYLVEYQSGFRSDDASGYIIEQNEFKQNGSFVNTSGVDIYFSGSDPNLVYNNVFEDTKTQEHYYGDNSTPFLNLIGLESLCNTHKNYSNTETDLHNEDGRLAVPLGSPIKSIKAIQGDPNESTGNIYSNAQYRFRNQSGRNITYHYSGTSGASNSLYPISGSGSNHGPLTPLVANTAHACSTNYLVSSPNGLDLKPNMLSNYYIKRKQYDQLLYTYFQNIDGGNTDSLINAINLTLPSEAQQLRDDLMAEAPYVSQEALMDAAATGILTDALLLEICLANPEATQTEDFLNYVEFDIPNPLPAIMVQMIYQNWETQTPRTIIENNISKLSRELGLESSQILRHYALDSSDFADSAKNILLSRKDLNSQYRLVEFAIYEANYDEANSIMEYISLNHELNDEQWSEHQNLIDYINFRQQLSNEGITYLQLNETQLESLRAIANAHRGRTAGMARNILCFGYQECESGFPIENEPLARKRSPRVYDFKNKVTLGETVLSSETSVYPNPFDQTINVEIANFDKNLNYQLVIEDLNGRKVLSYEIKSASYQLDASDLVKGSYLLRIFTDKEQILNQIIIKN